MKFGNLSGEGGFWKAKQKKQKHGTLLLLSLWKSRPVFGQLKKLKKACCSQMRNRALQYSFTMSSSKRLKAASALSLPVCHCHQLQIQQGCTATGNNQPSPKSQPRWCWHNLLWVPLLLPWWGQQTDKWEGQRAWGTSIWGGQERQDHYIPFSSSSNGLKQSQHWLGKDIKGIPL